MSLGSQSSQPTERSVRGQVNQRNWEKIQASSQDAATVPAGHVHEGVELPDKGPPPSGEVWSGGECPGWQPGGSPGVCSGGGASCGKLGQKN